MTLVLSQSAFDLEARLAEVNAAGGGVIEIPAGTYTVNGLTIGANDITVRGIGRVILRHTGTAGSHIFENTAGYDRLTFENLEVDLQRSLLTAGNAASFLFSVRSHDLSFRGLYIRDGIEEGIKLYNNKRVRVERCRFSNIRNNGIQNIVQPTDSFTGDETAKPPDNCEWFWVTDSIFEDIDDGLDGKLEGQPIATGAPLTATKQMRHVYFQRNYVARCLRGPWCENNAAGLPAEHIHFDGNTLEDIRWWGVGLIGVNTGSANGNLIKDMGAQAPNPPTTSDDIVGVRISGSADPRGANITVVGNTITDLRGSPFMRKGVSIASADRVLVRGNNIQGATIADIEGFWAGGAPVSLSVIEPSPMPSFKMDAVGGGQTATNNAWTAIEWDATPEVLYGVTHSTGANPERVTPKLPGVYMLHGAAVFPSDATGQRGVRINDSTGKVLGEVVTNAAAGSDDTALAVTAMVKVTAANIDAGYFWRFDVFQDRGSDMTVAPDTDRFYFGGEMVNGRTD